MIGKGFSVTLKNCKTNICENKEKIAELMNKLVGNVGMIKLGRIQIERGSEHLPGLSAVQMIETSHIALHCFSNSVSYMFSIESCKDFDEDELKHFLIDYFRPKNTDINSIYSLEV